MLGRLIEIESDGQYLSRKQGFMLISKGRTEIARIPLDDIAVVLCNAHGLTYSNSLLVEFAHRGIVAVVCGANHLPVSWIWPLKGHHVQSKRMRAQLEATKPLRKRLWQSIVQAKIMQQQAVLARIGTYTAKMSAFTKQVRSGDPDNIEAQAARYYWPLLLGKAFRRNRNETGVNTLLNYGYSIIRSAMARAIVTTGLHPSVGIHHHNPTNDMCLVDDLMEPFRPIVDLYVYHLAKNNQTIINKQTKRILGNVIYLDMATSRGTTPLLACLEQLALSVSRSFETGKVQIDLPKEILPLEFPLMNRTMNHNDDDEDLC